MLNKLFPKGYMTYITVGVGLVFSIAGLFGFDLPVEKEQVTDAIGVIILLAMGFLRRAIP